jgi:hypothetical protein
MLSMTAVFAVIATLAVLISAMTFALIWLGGRYDKLVGRPTGKPTPVPWLRSTRAEDTDLLRSERGNTALEMIVIGSTVTAIISLEIWFCFFAGSPLPAVRARTVRPAVHDPGRSYQRRSIARSICG